MILMADTEETPGQGAPRVSGDDPGRLRVGRAGLACSPRERG